MFKVLKLIGKEPMEGISETLHQGRKSMTYHGSAKYHGLDGEVADY
jgi:hypothetical protein